MPHRQIGDLLAARKSHGASEDQEGAGSVPGHCGEGTLDVAGSADVREHDRQAELPRCRLQRRRLGAGAADLAKDRYAGALGNDLVQDLQLFGDELRTRAQCRTGNVPTRPRKAGDEPRADRVDRPRHDDGYDRGGLL